MEQKLAKLQTMVEADNTLAEQLFALEKPEDVQNLLKEQGLEFSLEELSVFRNAVIKVLEKGTAELSDDELEEVAGGVAVTSIIIASAAVVSASAAVVGATATTAAATHNITRGRW